MKSCDSCGSDRVWMKIKLHCVNIVELEEDSIIEIHSFSQTKKGNKAAEALFRKLIQRRIIESSPRYSEDDIDEDDMEMYVDDGVFEDFPYKVCIEHS